MKEFNLSEKIFDMGKPYDATLKAEDVKEFIKKLKEEIDVDGSCSGSVFIRSFKDDVLKKINKLAGSKLTEK